MKPRLLIADTDERYRTLVEHAFRAGGYAVTVAGSSDEAVRAARAVRPDAVVIDLRLPADGGVETMQRIRAAAGPLPFVLLAGCGLSCEGFGVWSADACVVKSDDLGELERVVGSLLAGDRDTAASGSPDTEGRPCSGRNF